MAHRRAAAGVTRPRAGVPTEMQTQSVAKAVPGSSAAIQVRTHAPFALGLVLWRDESSRVLATVVAKATYNLAQGTSEVVEEPNPVRHPDAYWEDGAAGSLRFPPTSPRSRARTRSSSSGTSTRRGTRPAHAAMARIVVGGIEKLLEATSPRRSDRDGNLQVGPPQTRFSLRYELAAGGVNNPSGINTTDLNPMGGHVVPQLRPPNLDVRPGDYVPPVSFGPLSRAWPLRDSLLRPQDREWLLESGSSAASAGVQSTVLLLGSPRPALGGGPARR